MKFKLFINLIAIVGITVSFFIEDKFMSIFFLLALILSELEDLHSTLKELSKK